MSLSSQRAYKASPDTIYYELGEKFTEHSRPPSRMVLGLQEGVVVVAVVYNPDPHRRTQLLTIRTSTPYVEVRLRAGGEQGSVWHILMQKFDIFSTIF